MILSRFLNESIDYLYLKSYYHYIETPMMNLLSLFSKREKLTFNENDFMFTKVIKYLLNILIKNKLALSTYNKVFLYLIKTILYAMPIRQINTVMKHIRKEKEISMSYILAKKQ